MQLLLLPYKNEENELLKSIKEHSEILSSIKDTLVKLSNSFELMNQIYGRVNADLVAVISDLVNKAQSPNLKPADVEPPKKVKRSIKKRATVTYRRICNLCHPDKLKHKNFSEDTVIQLISLYQEAQKANKTKDLPTLQIILNKVMDLYGTKSHDLQEKFKDCLDKVELKDELDAIMSELSSRRMELDNVINSALFKVLTHHTRGESALASLFYRNLLLMNVNALQTNFNNSSN